MTKKTFHIKIFKFRDSGKTPKTMCIKAKKIVYYEKKFSKIDMLYL